MARIRTIKPSFFESDDVAVLPFRARLLWIGLWTHCDDEGRTKDNTKLIKARIWPLDQVSLKDIDDDLATLAVSGRIERYEADGQRYLEITNWRDHQSINHPSKSKIPPPPVNGKPMKLSTGEQSRSPTGDIPEPYPGEGKGREGKGRDAREARDNYVTASEPPPRCPQHINNPKPPACGNCADARRTHDEWRAERDRRLRDAPKCRKHRGQPQDNCALCRAEALGGVDD